MNGIVAGDYIFNISDQMCHQAFNIGGKTLHPAHVMDISENTLLMLNNLSEANKKLTNEEEHLKVKDIFHHHNKCFVVYETLPKEAVTLLDLMKAKNNLPENFVRKVSQLLLAYIAQIHKHNVAHLDLKLQNIYIFKSNGQWKIKVKDLRFCQNFNSNNSFIESRRGSPAYLAPEVTLSGHCYDAKKAEIYTAGVILYTLATGTYPFVASNPQELIEAIRCSPLHFPSNISSSLRNLLENMLSKNPELRCDSSILLKHPWIQDAETKTTINSSSNTENHSTQTLHHLVQSCVHASSSAGNASYITCLPPSSKPATVC